jgi:hypothetical protein
MHSKIPLPKNIEKQEDLDHSLIIKRTDGVIEVHCGDLAIYSSEKVKENHACIKKFGEGKKALVLTIAGVYTHVMPEARKYTSQGPHKDIIAAEAFLVTSFAQWILAGFFVKINRPIVPANFFRMKDKAKAEAWLAKFRD